MNIIPHFIRCRIEHRPNLLKIVDNIGWLFFDKILRMGVGLIVGVWLARYLGPEHFGLYSFATAFIALFGAIAGLGMQGIVIRDIVRNPANKEETLGTAALLQLIGGLLAYGLALFTIFWVRPEDTLTQALVAILGSTILFKIGDVAVYWFESQVQSKYTVWVQNSSFLAFALIKILLILNDASLIAFASATVGEAVVAAMLMILMLDLRGPKLHNLRIKMTRARRLLVDSWPLLLSSIAIMIYLRVDQIMLGQMMGDEEVGLYTAATRISEVWYFIPMMIVASVYPAILEAKKRSESEYYKRLQQLYDLMSFLSVGMALLMTFLSTPVMIMLFGNEFAASGSVLSIHIWASVFVFLGVASGKWYLAENLQLVAFQKALFGALSNIALNFLLIPNFGFLGSAWATVISYALADFVFDLFYKKTRVNFQMKVNSLNVVKKIKAL